MSFKAMVYAVIVFGATLSALGQVRGGANPAGGARTRREPCSEVAGISQSALQQRRSLEESAKSQIASVCADSALTAKQKAEEIKAIRERTKQEVQALITPQQEEALQSCRKSRGHEEEPHPHHGTGPCGELPEASGPPTKQP
jgi:hypothetical protein